VGTVKLQLDRRAWKMSTTIAYILVSVLVSAMAQIMLKKGMSSLGPLTLSLPQLGSIVWQIATNPYVVSGLCVYVVGTLFWLSALSRVELSFAYPFASLSYVIMLVASWRIFQEDISLIRVIGTLVIGLGVILVSRT
jgi:drug/metabolite transporter (DMT)-like permease